MSKHHATSSTPTSEGCCCGDNASESHRATSRKAPHRHNHVDEGVREVSKNHEADCGCGHDHNHEQAEAKPVAPQGA